MHKARALVATPPTFKDFLDKYPPEVLHAAVNGLQDSISWELMRAFLRTNQRAFEVASLDLMGHSGKGQEAAKASGYAQACEDVADRFMQDLINAVAGKNGLVEGPAREEEI